MHLLSFHRRIVSAGLLLMVIDWIFENCYSVANIATEAKTITTAVFMDDSNAGPNITALDEIGHWGAFGHPDYTKGSDAFMLDPNNKWYLYK